MSGTDIVGRVSRTAAETQLLARARSRDRLAWPVAALLILGTSAGLWIGVAALAHSLLT